MKIPKMPTLALIDADIVVYRLAHICDVEGTEDAADWLRHDMKAWTPPGCTDVVAVLSCPRSENFRRDWWPKYKAHRDTRQHEPDTLGCIKELVWEMYNTKQVDRVEADDLMGICQSKEIAVTSTIDKDLKTIPGWLYNPDKMSVPLYIHEVEADYNFHLQWLMGDSTDNIPGIPRVGIKTAEKILAAAKGNDWTTVVRAMYESKGFDEDYCNAQGVCVRILRDGEWADKSNDIPFDTSFLGSERGLP